MNPRIALSLFALSIAGGVTLGWVIIAFHLEVLL